MLAFLLRQVIQAAAVLAVVGLIAFAMFRFAGDPVNQIVGPDTTAAERAQIRTDLGLDDPVLVQFVRYAGSVVRGQFGISYQFRQPVWKSWANPSLEAAATVGLLKPLHPKKNHIKAKVA